MDQANEETVTQGKADEVEPLAVVPATVPAIRGEAARGCQEGTLEAEAAAAPLLKVIKPAHPALLFWLIVGCCHVRAVGGSARDANEHP